MDNYITWFDEFYNHAYTHSSTKKLDIGNFSGINKLFRGMCFKYKICLTVHKVGYLGYRQVSCQMCLRGVSKSYKKRVRPFGWFSGHFRVNVVISWSYFVLVTLSRWIQVSCMLKSYISRNYYASKWKFIV